MKQEDKKNQKLENLLSQIDNYQNKMTQEDWLYLEKDKYKTQFLPKEDPSKILDFINARKQRKLNAELLKKKKEQEDEELGLKPLEIDEEKLARDEIIEKINSRVQSTLACTSDRKSQASGKSLVKKEQQKYDNFLAQFNSKLQVEERHLIKKVHVEPQTFIKDLDQNFQNYQEAYNQIITDKQTLGQNMQGIMEGQIEYYTAQVIDNLQNSSQVEKMKFTKQKPTPKMDIKSKMLRDYCDPIKGIQFKNIDMERIEKEKDIKHMKVSDQRLIVQCKDDIGRCANYGELKHQLEADQWMNNNDQENIDSGSYNKKANPKTNIIGKTGAFTMQQDKEQIPSNPFEALMGSHRNNADCQKIVESYNQQELLKHVGEYYKKQHQENKLRLKYNPQQMSFKRALQAQTISEEGGLLNDEKREKYQQMIQKNNHRVSINSDNQQQRDNISAMIKCVNQDAIDEFGNDDQNDRTDRKRTITSYERKSIFKTSLMPSTRNTMIRKMVKNIHLNNNINREMNKTIMMPTTESNAPVALCGLFSPKARDRRNKSMLDENYTMNSPKHQTFTPQNNEIGNGQQQLIQFYNNNKQRKGLFNRQMHSSLNRPIIKDKMVLTSPIQNKIRKQCIDKFAIQKFDNNYLCTESSIEETKNRPKTQMIRRQKYGGKTRNQMGLSLELQTENAFKIADTFNSFMSGGTMMNSMMIQSNIKSDVTEAFPYNKIAEENYKAIEQFEPKIKLETRRNMVLNTVFNPNITKVDNQNDSFIKEKKQQEKKKVLSIVQCSMNDFNSMKDKMVPFSVRKNELSDKEESDKNNTTPIDEIKSPLAQGLMNNLKKGINLGVTKQRIKNRLGDEFKGIFTKKNQNQSAYNSDLPDNFSDNQTQFQIKKKIKSKTKVGFGGGGWDLSESEQQSNQQKVETDSEDDSFPVFTYQVKQYAGSIRIPTPKHKKAMRQKQEMVQQSAFGDNKQMLEGLKREALENQGIRLKQPKEKNIKIKVKGDQQQDQQSNNQVEQMSNMTGMTQVTGRTGGTCQTINLNQDSKLKSTNNFYQREEQVAKLAKIERDKAQYKNFETFHAIKRDVEDWDADTHGKEYWIQIRQYYYNSWVPQAREGALLIENPDTSQVYLYGGVAQEPLKGVASLTLNGQTRCKWDILTANYMVAKDRVAELDGDAEGAEDDDDEDAPDERVLKGRTGFRGCFYRNRIYFIFGCEMFDQKRKMRKCLGDIVRFDPYTNNIDKEEPKHKPERLLLPRKYFAGFLLHNYFFCHGGTSWSETAKDQVGDQVLNSFIKIDLNTFIWSDVKLPRQPQEQAKPSPFSFMKQEPDINMNTAHAFGHRMVVVTYKRSFIKFDELGECDYDNEPFSVANEGVYMFGGVIGKSAQSQVLSNKTFFMQIGKNVKLGWRQVKTKGIPPIGRYHHGLHYYRPGNIMVVLGGRRIVGPDSNDRNSEFVSQICVLRMDSLTWSTVKFKGPFDIDDVDIISMPKFPDLYNYSSALIGDNIIVFGGMRGDGVRPYALSKDMWSVSLMKFRECRYDYALVENGSNKSNVPTGVQAPAVDNTRKISIDQ